MIPDGKKKPGAERRCERIELSILCETDEFAEPEDAARGNLPMGGIGETTHLHMESQEADIPPPRSRDGPDQSLVPTDQENAPNFRHDDATQKIDDAAEKWPSYWNFLRLLA